MRSIFHYASRATLLLLLAAGLLVAGCDSGGALDDGGDTGSESATISGQATDDPSSDGSKAAKAGVEGATVTAVSVHADGTTTPLDGEATTDASGAFTIEVEGEGASGVVRLNAEGEGDYTSSAVVLVDGESEVETQPLTAETSAEADVYLEAKGDGSEEHHEGVTLADVAAYVGAEAAAGIEAGEASATDVAAALRNAVEAEAAYHSENETGVDASAIATAKNDAYAQLQSDLAVASDADARLEAVESFEATLGSLHADAGASAEAQAEGRQAGTALLIEFSASSEVSGDAALGLRKQAEMLSAYATARATEAAFEAKEGTESSLDALADARTTLVADIRAATSVDAIVNAKANYEETVQDELATSFAVSASMVAAAETNIEENAGATLQATLNGIVDLLLGDAVSAALDAYATFYADAQTAAESALETSEDAEACATVLVQLEGNAAAGASS